MATRTHQFLLAGDTDGQVSNRWGLIYTEGAHIATALRPDSQYSEERMDVLVDEVREFGQFLLEVATLMDAAVEGTET